MDSNQPTRAIRKVILLNILLTIRIYRKKLYSCCCWFFIVMSWQKCDNLPHCMVIITGIDIDLFNTIFEENVVYPRMISRIMSVKENAVALSLAVELFRKLLTGHCHTHFWKTQVRSLFLPPCSPPVTFPMLPMRPMVPILLSIVPGLWDVYNGSGPKNWRWYH